ncbi:MAG: carboxypeptidase regulatory-like domain-containing protein [Fulvimarina manganoxydans]|uniref:carboxypeptidase-like regulatory domain-containing protein n=1 Tax=Fulvimarina manganoxydans TaxID=937218 RepID=UPI002352D0D5|nr:carboxypeptidase-like regulatory domain-containing protein [Fulvimarina manganoxydans]MCK5932291.1 carboxypeptidase regulatory-like domain-containing protein [Fulvimarina manganoxydans]
MRAICVCLTGLVLSGAVWADSAEAKSARCFSTDDGYFDCDFQMTDRDGSFSIEGPGVSYSLVIERPGFASAFVNLGDRNISLPGLYVRQTTDPACWANPETETKICAW